MARSLSRRVRPPSNSSGTHHTSGGTVLAGRLRNSGRPSRRGRPRRGFVTAGLVALLLLPIVLAGWTERSASARAGTDAGSVVEVDIVVVTAGRSRLYSSRQLPPDGRLVFARFAEEREQLGEECSPAVLAEWVFRVVPDADQVRVTLKEQTPERSSSFHYRRESFSIT